ncbi:MAG: hypothetical protein IPO00_08875 [Betaproteobacteria bacterium]|nr:hypothetical protein [Betaproteobacteria bacterium]
MADDWKSGLPEELRTAPALRDVQDVASLAKSFVETKAFVGSSLRPPGPDATPEARTDFIHKLREKVPELLFMPDGDDEPAKVARETAWAKLGRPKEAKEYTLPPEIAVSEEHLEALRKEAMDEGLTKGQFQARAKRVADAIAATEGARKDAAQALRKELGAAFDERTAAAAAFAAKRGMSPELVGALKSGTIDTPTFKMFSDLAKAFGETRQVADQNGGAGGRMTPTEAMAQRAEIMARPEYFRPNGAQMAVHENLKRKVIELNEMISGV